MLIRSADLPGRGIVDVRLSGGYVSHIASTLVPVDDEPVLQADGGALLPGLHDHHIHLNAAAAAFDSIACGPPQIADEAALAAGLRAAQVPEGGSGWLRAIGYHESVAGLPDLRKLDQWVPQAPLRLQHASGRLWMFNSAGLRRLGISDSANADDPLERVNGRLTGRLYDADAWLRARMGSERPNLTRLSRFLASRGVTGATDATHHNDAQALQAFDRAQQRGELLQRLRVMGSSALDNVADFPLAERGEHKFHLHEADLPSLDQVCDALACSALHGRGAAFHCVTRTELVFALAAIEASHSHRDNRIEHAAVAPDELLPIMRRLGVRVVTQPGFVASRGDRYIREVDVDDQKWLYRLAAFMDAGIAVGGSTDAPFGDADPWLAMHAAVTRRTAKGAALGLGERVTPERAIALFTSPVESPGGPPRTIHPGAVADLCLLADSWNRARAELDRVRVRATFRSGRCIWNSEVRALS